MGEYQHYNSFCLRSPITGETKSLKDDYNGIIINENAITYDRECMPDLNIITDKISGVDGELFMKANYQPRVISMTVFFGEIEKTDGDFVRFKEWVGKKYPQEFSWEDDWEEDKYLNVLLYKGFETKTYYGKEGIYNGKVDLQFIAYDPLWRIYNERHIIFENLSVGDNKNIKSKGNVSCNPLIYITPLTTEIGLKWNDLNITLKNLTIGQEYIIDCETEKFYYKTSSGIIVNCIDKYSSNVYLDYPIIDIDLTNNFKITKGKIKKIDIDPRSLIL